VGSALHGTCISKIDHAAQSLVSVNERSEMAGAFGKKQRKKVPRAKNGSGMRARATRALAQGAGAVPRKATGLRSLVTSVPRGLPQGCWNAHSSAPAGLPRAVGPYTIVRTTTIITSKSPLLIFGTYANQAVAGAGAPTGMRFGNGLGEKYWTNVCAVGAPEEMSVSEFNDAAISGGTHTQVHMIPVPGTTANGVFAFNVAQGQTPTFENGYSNTTAVPSAVSVQIINPTAVQTAAGTGIAAVCPVRLDLAGTEKTWRTIGDEILSYYRPRVLTGGKLALRGVQMDSLPLSMTDVSDFREVWGIDPLMTAPSTMQWSYQSTVQNIVGAPALSDSQKTFGCHIHPEGWAPMVYYSPYNASRAPADRQEMSFLVTMEWRVRFDISNPACSSHALHKPSSDVQWHNMISKAVSVLPGVIDIVEKVANAGARMAKYAPVE